MDQEDFLILPFRFTKRTVHHMSVEYCRVSVIDVVVFTFKYICFKDLVGVYIQYVCVCVCVL